MKMPRIFNIIDLIEVFVYGFFIALAIVYVIGKLV